MSKKISNYLVLTHLYDHIVMDRAKLAHWSEEELASTGQLGISLLRRTVNKDGVVEIKDIHHEYLFLLSDDQKKKIKEEKHFDFDSYIKSRFDAIDALCQYFNSRARKRDEAIEFYNNRVSSLYELFNELDDINIW